MKTNKGVDREMKELFKLFTKGIYPALISLFLFIFTTSFVSGEYLESLQLITCITAVIFGIVFVVGVVVEMFFAIKNSKNK